jgi:hypothetical protein
MVPPSVFAQGLPAFVSLRPGRRRERWDGPEAGAARAPAFKKPYVDVYAHLRDLGPGWQEPRLKSGIPILQSRHTGVAGIA